MPIVAIVGRPNVGKSTLFNRLLGHKKAIIAREAGTTRDTVSGEVTWDGRRFILFDTAGVISDFYGYKEAEIEKLAQDKIAQALQESDLILMVMDAKVGVTNEDKEIASQIRKLNKKVLVVMNKADNPHLESRIAQAQELGFSDAMPVSSINGRRSGLLLDKIVKNFKKSESWSSPSKKIAIVGRPNAGKSTLFNILAEQEKAIVSNIPGTTRDAITTKLQIGGKSAEIIDTAGFRKRGKIQVGIEKFSIFRAIQSILRSDLVILVIDAREGFTRTDAHLAALAKHNSKDIVVVINKIDLLKTRVTTEVKNFERFGFILKNKIFAISCKSGENVDELIDEIGRLV